MESWKKKKEKMKDVKVTRKKKSIEPVVKKEKLESSLSMSPSRSKPGRGIYKNSQGGGGGLKI